MMRKPDAAAIAAGKSIPGGSRDNAPAELVCMALVLALIALALRIATVW